MLPYLPTELAIVARSEGADIRQMIPPLFVSALPVVHKTLPAPAVPRFAGQHRNPVCQSGHATTTTVEPIRLLLFTEGMFPESNPNQGSKIVGIYPFTPPPTPKCHVSAEGQLASWAEMVTTGYPKACGCGLKAMGNPAPSRSQRRKAAGAFSGICLQNHLQ